MNVIDTHCHYNLSPLYENWQHHWQKAQSMGISASIVVGTAQYSTERVTEIVQDEDCLYLAPGVHPTAFQHRLKTSNESAAQFLETELVYLESVLTNPTLQEKIVAIGETGCDYFRNAESEPNYTTIREVQLELFRRQLQLANEHQLPAILHLRDTVATAYQDALCIVKEHTPQTIILHCMSGSPDFITQMLEFNTYFGVDGNVTYPKSDQLRELVNMIPEDRLLLETDAPYLPPQGYRGKTCEPWMITETAKYLSSELGRDPEQILENTYAAFPKLKKS